jgi:virulence-associated protein VapD
MYAIAFDLVVRDTEQNHPSGNASQAYGDIRRTLER